MKYIKVTDDGAVGYHSVPDDFKLPQAKDHEGYEFVEESVVRKAHPALFEPAPAPVKK